jgi:hypothetical protein
MKLRDKIIVGSLILLLILLHRYLFTAKEGFFDDSSDYTALKNRLIKDLEPYCKVAILARNNIKDALSSSKNPSDDISINNIYKSVYSCTDSLASSRQSCSGILTGGLGPNTSMEYVSCDIYTKLPEWSDDGSAAIALTKITNNLPERIVREADWISTNIKKLKSALAAGENPPTTPPSKEDLNKLAEGFDGSCSADAARAKKLLAEAQSCSIPDIKSEIARVNTLLDSPQLKQIVSKMDALYAEMQKVYSDLEKLKNGTLYEWQKDGPTKSYPQFKGGDRTAAFMFSLQQNR